MYVAYVDESGFVGQSRNPEQPVQVMACIMPSDHNLHRTSRELPGSPDDFHNAVAEAMKMDDPQLAFSIVEQGLRHHPDQFDLMADMARA